MTIVLLARRERGVRYDLLLISKVSPAKLKKFQSMCILVLTSKSLFTPWNFPLY